MQGNLHNVYDYYKGGGLKTLHFASSCDQMIGFGSFHHHE